MTGEPQDPYLGNQIREYQILEVIGRGGMGAVYKARHIYLDEERAIKVVHSEFTSDEQFVGRFIREAKMMSRLSHPNLVRLHEFGTLPDGSFFMVQEFIRGESVLHRMNRAGRIPIADAVRIVIQAALGLQAAHEQDIVHRDISPDNLLLVREKDGTERTKVIDFGIAKPLMDQTRIYTKTHMFLGKPEFCSPEQCGMLEEGEIIDHRSDIYSLGITLYFMLAGKLPFYSPTPQGYLLKHFHEKPTPIVTHFAEGEFPKELGLIIDKTLEKNRDQRYKTMQEFAQALQRFADSYKPTPAGDTQMTPDEIHAPEKTEIIKPD